MGARSLAVVGLALVPLGCHLVFPHASSGPGRDGSTRDAMRAEGVDLPVPPQADGPWSGEAGMLVDTAVKKRDAVSPVDAPAPVPCVANSNCPPNWLCDLLGCGATGGTCVKVEATCPENLAQVCGCDGTTYANDCERIKAGAILGHAGPCLIANDAGPICPVCKPNECCEKGACVPSGFTSCGRPGELCVPCLVGDTCLGGRCVPTTCLTTCSGCCEPTACYNNSGGNNLHCGKAGESCVACGAGSQCLGGVCQ